MILLVILAILATWRITYMVQNENAPGAVFAKLRKKLRVGEYNDHSIKPGSFRDLMQCFKCLSFWAALPWALYIGWGSWQLVVLLLLAIAAGAIFLQDYAEKRGM